MVCFILTVANAVITIMILAILLRALLSFAPLDPYHPLNQVLYRITEPILEPFRRFVPQVGMFDFTPLVATVVLFLASWIIQQVC